MVLGSNSQTNSEQDGGVQPAPRSAGSRSPIVVGLIRGEYRKLDFHRFRYAKVYIVQDDALYIKPLMHLRRKAAWDEVRPPSTADGQKGNVTLRAETMVQSECVPNARSFKRLV